MDLLRPGDNTLAYLMLAGFGLLAVGAYIYVARDAKRLEKNGSILEAWVVIVDDAIYSPGMDRTVGMFVLSLPGELQAGEAELAAIVNSMRGLRSAPDQAGPVGVVQKLCRKNKLSPAFQTVLPMEFTGGKEVHCVHIDVHRPYLAKGGVLTKPYVQVAAERTKNPGKINWMMIPYRYRSIKQQP
jgi:hypothetical protein